jgi:hypothetical protein
MRLSVCPVNNRSCFIQYLLKIRILLLLCAGYAHVEVVHIHIEIQAAYRAEPRYAVIGTKASR